MWWVRLCVNQALESVKIWTGIEAAMPLTCKWLLKNHCGSKYTYWHRKLKIMSENNGLRNGGSLLRFSCERAMTCNLMPPLLLNFLRTILIEERISKNSEEFICTFKLMIQQRCLKFIIKSRGGTQAESPYCATKAHPHMLKAKRVTHL